MEITEVKSDKKQYLPLLLLADEQEDMVDRYLERGTMFVLEDGGVKGECVVTDEGNGVVELKSIAVAPAYQRRGYGKALINFIVKRCSGRYSTLQVGTGDSPQTILFYEGCGFTRSHVVKNFFTDHYDHPIYEGGVQLTDMIYLKRNLLERSADHEHPMVSRPHDQDPAADGGRPEAGGPGGGGH